MRRRQSGLGQERGQVHWLPTEMTLALLPLWKKLRGHEFRRWQCERGDHLVLAMDVFFLVSQTPWLALDFDLIVNPIVGAARRQTAAP